MNAKNSISQLVKRVYLLPQSKIGIATGISGFSQLVLLVLPASSLEFGSLADLILWQSLSAGFGILISGVIGTLAFSVFVAGENQPATKRLSSMLLNILILVFFLGVALTILSFFVFSESFLFYSINLFVSLFLYLFGSIQSSFYSAGGHWSALSAQLAIDGVLRSVAVIWITWKLESNIYALVLVSLLSQAFSIFVVSIWSPWWRGFSKRSKGIMSFAKDLTPLTSTTMGSLLITTFPPVLLQLAGAPSSLVATIGILVVIARIPTTLISPLALPQVRQVCVQYLDHTFQAGFKIFTLTLRKLSAVAVFVIATIWLFAFAIPQIEFLDPLGEIFHDYGIVMNSLLSFLALLLVLESFADSCLNGQGRFLESGKIFLYSSIAWISIMFFVNFKVSESALSILWALVFGVSIILIQLIIRMLPINSTQTVRLPI